MKKYRNYIIAIVILIALCITLCFIPINATRFIPEVEKQAKQELGIDVHIDKLIFRFGPSLKIKAPVLHLIYPDGQKFGQLDNVKFFVPWSTLFSDSVPVKRIYADKFILKLNSSDKFLPELISNIQTKDYDILPNIRFNSYSISYNATDIDKLYQISGSPLVLNKLVNYKNIKLASEGNFSINSTPYVSYNINIQPNIQPKAEPTKCNIDLLQIAKQIENLDFHSDIIADLKFSESKNDNLEISGLVNIDNISVLDADKKNPKSFIYLTFLGNKIGIVSNIYAAPDKKINAEGVINNSKKPEIDLKVKTDKIQLADAYKKIKLLVDCSRYKDIDSIDGTLIADFNLKGDLNKIKSTGYLKVTDASVKANGINVKNINSDIDFSNNIINITKAVGYVNNAPIMLKGQIDKNINLEILMDKVELKDILPKSFGVQNGIISLDATLNGTFDNITHKENIKIQNFKSLINKNTLSFDSLNINTNINNIANISNIIIKPSNIQNIKLPLLKLGIDNEKIKIQDTNIFMPNSKFTANAEILNYNTRDWTFNFNMNGNLNSRDVVNNTQISSSVYPIIININGNKSVQNIDTKVQILKASVFYEPSLVNFIAKLENNNLKIDELSLVAFNGNLLRNFKQNNKLNKKIIINGTIENIFNPIYKNVRVFIPQQLELNINNTIAQLKGDVFINGKLKQPDIVGQLSASNVINQFMQLSLNNVNIEFNKNIMSINAPIIKLADSIFGVNAIASTNFNDEYLIKNVNIKSKYINTDTVLMYKDAPIIANFPVKIKEGKLYIERVLATVYGEKLLLTAMNSDFKLENNILSVKNIYSELFNGKLAGNLNYDLKCDTYNLEIQGRNVSAEPIFNILIKKKDTLSGTMDFDANVQGDMLSKESLNGNVKFMIHNGHMGMLGKLEHLLYAQNVIADNMLRTSLSTVTKAITLKDTGLFKYLRGDLNIKNGVAYINLLQSQGPLMALHIKGQYNPLTDYANLVVLGRLSDELTNCLGPFGEFSINKLMIILTGNENKQNISIEDLDKLPQLPMKNTKEFRTIINGQAEKPSSVVQFNWISYSQKSLRQKEVPMTNEKLPEFIENLPY